MKESVIQSKIINYLKSRGAYVVKTISTSKAGVPDVLACYKGRFYGFEIKNETGEPSFLQVYNIEKIRASGGIAGIVRSVDDVSSLLSDGNTHNRV